MVQDLSMAPATQLCEGSNLLVIMDSHLFAGVALQASTMFMVAAVLLTIFRVRAEPTPQYPKPQSPQP